MESEDLPVMVRFYYSWAVKAEEPFLLAITDTQGYGLTSHNPDLGPKVISTLSKTKLDKPIRITVELDESIYLAKCIDLPIYATGTSSAEAVDNLRDELYDLYLELKDEENENLSDEWIGHKQYLEERIGH